MNGLYQDYLALIKRFLANELSIEEFQTIYFDNFKNETRAMSEPLYLLLNGVFLDLDAYTDDAYLLAKDSFRYIDKKTLLERLAGAVEQLERLEDKA